MVITNDTIIHIATAESRKDTHWRNIAITWEQLKERCRHTRTAETAAEYAQMTKAQRGNVKDVGGFVGGTLKEDGNRRNENLKERTLLTIDIDDATEMPQAPNPRFALILHSTHSHTEAAPRYRIIVPLSRPCSPIEYQAVAHKMAEAVGLEQVDITSCEPVRLMYWASAPKDAPVIYTAQDGEPLDVDGILGLYKDWSNPDEWATKERASGTAYSLPLTKRVRSERQSSPREKPNLIGSWCRTFSVFDVLNDMLAGVYVPAGLNRYTYAEGSTFGGVCVYDDGDFFFSFHQSDPLGGQLLNSWDLYRLARFGHLDRDAAPTTRTDRLPSSEAMREYALSVPAVKRDYLTRQVNEAAGEEGITGSEEEVPPTEGDWIDVLETDSKGHIANTLNNFYLILKHDPNLIKDRVIFDEIKLAKTFLHPPLWERTEGDTWTDADTAQVALYIERAYHIKSRGDLQTALDAVCTEDAFRRNPVREFIRREEWDGTPRMDTLFVDTLGAEDTPLTRSITRKSLVACVARSFDPGCKYDQITVLVGEQGIGKSSVLRRLAGGGKYFMDSFTLDSRSNKMQESVLGAWIVEIPELDGLYRADMNAIKSFVSKQWDEFRPAYAREKILAKRTCVFFATTNDDDFLRDASGNRRFWILKCDGNPRRSVFDLDSHYIAQVWAEAYEHYKAGDTPLYLDRAQEGQLAELQKRYDSDNDLIGSLEAFLDTLLPYDWDTFQMDERRAYFQAVKRGEPYYRDPTTQVKSIPTKLRTEVSAIEVVNEFLMQDNGKGNRQARLATDLLRKIDGWEQADRKVLSGGYGRQKIFVRK